MLRLRLRSLGSRTDAGQHPGNGARVFLGSAELGAVVALDGVLPTPERYFAEYDAKVVPHADEVYRYLQLDTAGRFDAVYGRREL